MKSHLLVIDQQQDFCIPGAPLFVHGADADSDRIAQFISKNDLAQIHLTMDSHNKFDVAHQMMWVDDNGNHPDIFTSITYSDVVSGKWKPVLPELLDKMLAYTKKLEENGKYTLMVWPDHCIIGSQGWNLEPKVFDAVQNWQAKKLGEVPFFWLKGSNPYTEHYSVIEAEVPDADDVLTHTNRNLITALNKADRLFVVGEALSHCVASTLTDLIKYINPKKIMLLTDASSPVHGCDALAQAFLKNMTDCGVHLGKTTDVF